MPSLAEILGQVFDRSLQRGLAQAHHVVMRHHLFGAVIGQRQHAAARTHQRARPPRNGGEGIDRDVHRHQEVRAAGVDIAAAQFVLVGEADGMDHEIQPAPGFTQGFEQGIHACVACDVAFVKEWLAKACRQWLHPLSQRVALVAEGQFRPLRRDGLGNPPGDRPVIGQPHDQAALSRHQSG
jgi:hypothetical protein